MQDQIIIFDTTLRDGEQAPGYSMNLEEKLKMAKRLENLSVNVIEAGFAIASPGDFEAVKEISENAGDITIASLSRALEKDIDASYEATKNARRPRIHTFLATSDLHLEYKLKMSREDALDRIVKMVKYARNLCGDVEFSLEDATRTDLDYMCRVVEAAIASGATTINLPDTVGYSTPSDIEKMFKTVLNKVPNVDKAILSAHCHNDLGLGLANSLAAIKAGARQVEGTICGIGERAGNTALEEFAMAIKTRNDIYPFDYSLKTQEIYKTARTLSSITNIKPFPSKAIVGANAFAHESGIHQHGVMANAKTYEIMTPESVGMVKTEFVLGKHSGQHAFVKRMEDLGYSLNDEDAKRLFKDFKALCDRKKTINNRDLLALVESTEQWGENDWTLDSFVVNSGNTMTSTACVTLLHKGKKYQEVAVGSGPVYAAIRAVEKLVKHPFGLCDYSLNAVTEHRDAQGEVFVKISDGKEFYRGRGVSTDVIEASILSTLAAVNHMLNSNEYSLGSSINAQQLSLDEDMLVGHSDKKVEEA
ncbi:MAG: 2-isopropylmalate synthase [Sphaerochaetaceae bacterium]|nr:2-isopropylmalate synthase [Sphaerochaetaceae bacterium]